MSVTYWECLLGTEMSRLISALRVPGQNLLAQVNVGLVLADGRISPDLRALRVMFDPKRMDFDSLAGYLRLPTHYPGLQIGALDKEAREVALRNQDHLVVLADFSKTDLLARVYGYVLDPTDPRLCRAAIDQYHLEEIEAKSPCGLLLSVGVGNPTS